jgi:methyl acetate hydrolase
MTAQLSRRNALLRTAAIAATGALPGMPFPGVAEPARALPKINEIDALLQAKVDSSEVPGVVAMAATEQSVIYQGAFGVRNKTTATKMSADTVFRIASMVKLLTSVAAMQLVEAGKLKLDEPAGRIDPTLESPQVLTGFDAKGVPQLRPANKPITLRSLLSHTSGFCYQLWDPNVLRYVKIAHGNKSLPRMPLMFDPGAKWAYGGSIDRVSRLVEIASGKAIDQYFRDHICGPLGMSDTGFMITDKQRAREASLHLRNIGGKFVPQPMEKPPVQRAFSGGGGIYSTAPDYLALLRALLNGGSLGGESILQRESVAQMFTNQIGDLEAGILKTINPALSSDVDFFPGIHLRWGIGGMLNSDPVAEGRAAGSLTWAGLYNTYFWIDPKSHLTGVIMMQVLPFADARALGVYRQFEHGVYRAFKAA